MALKLSLFSVRPGTSHSAPVEAMVGDYLLRCGRALPAAARAFRTEAALMEAVAAERKGGAAAFWMADLGGKAMSTETFARRMGEARDNGLRHLMIAIGSADGWSDVARAAADLRIALGEMTMPHELAWLVMAEQMYRASTILAGHPYHLGH